MYNLETGTNNFGSVWAWVEFAISAVIIVMFFIACIGVFRRKTSFFSCLIFCVLFLVSWFFDFQLIWGMCLALMSSLITIIFVQNPKELKLVYGSTFKKRKIGGVRVYDREAVCQCVAVAVEGLSKNRTGALITFEKNDKLTDIVKSGTMLNAPINQELLTTIFYPGTRLHDGAVVIRLDEILAASVYYTPTTRPLTGKFGSRHRAAIGISEVTDSVTVVVSEETGRISIAYKGELIPVAKDNLLKTLQEYLADEE